MEPRMPPLVLEPYFWFGGENRCERSTLGVENCCGKGSHRTGASIDSATAAPARRMHAAGEPVKTIAKTLGVWAVTVYRVVADD